MNTDYKVVSLGRKRQAYEHRLVWERHFGPIPDGYHVHHKNGNKRDNSLENLELLPASEHHREHFTAQGQTPEHKARARDNILGAWGSMPMLQLVCTVCGSDFEKRQHLTKGAAKYCSPSCRSKDYYLTKMKPKLIAEGKLRAA